MSTLVLVEAVTSLGPLRDGGIDDLFRHQKFLYRNSIFLSVRAFFLTYNYGKQKRQTASVSA